MNGAMVKAQEVGKEAKMETRYNMYCPQCLQWVMAKEIVTEWHETPSGMSRLDYVCPLCNMII